MEREELFTKADHLLFKEGKHEQAKQLYLSILEQDPKNIDAINSVAYCVKFASKSGISAKTFDELIELYHRSLEIDSYDVEANFNMGLLYLQVKSDLDLALRRF